MTDSNASLGNETLQLLCQDLDPLHAIMDEKDLSAPINLAQNSFTNQMVVVFSDSSANGQTLMRRCLDGAHITQVDQRHMQSTRDWGCGHGEHIDFRAH